MTPNEFEEKLDSMGIDIIELLDLASEWNRIPRIERRRMLRKALCPDCGIIFEDEEE